MDSSFIVGWLFGRYKDTIKPEKHKPPHQELETHSSDAEGDEIAFFDENPL